MENTKFLDFQTDNHLNLKNHTDKLILKWSMFCSHIEAHISNIATLILIYLTCFHSIIKYEIIFQGNCLHYTKDLLELSLVQNLEFQVEAYLKN